VDAKQTPTTDRTRSDTQPSPKWAVDYALAKLDYSPLL
jgi:hypothetical protein